MRHLPSWLKRLGNIAVLPEDDADLRALKRLQVILGWASIPVIALWGATFHLTGRLDLAAWPYGYCLATLAMLAHLWWTRSYPVYRHGHLLLVMLTTYAFHIRLGGFHGSGGAILWSLMVPMMAILFVGPRASVRFFVALVALILLSALREGPYAIAPELPPATVAFQFLLNTIGMASFVYLASLYFVSRMEEERARAERLLRNTLPEAIAERLKLAPEVIADSAPEVTVLFSDLVGFTGLSQTVRAEELVRMLNDIFRDFDELAVVLGVEKIKTIGDAYMVASGLPEPRPDHAAAAARMGMAMLAVVEQASARLGHPLSMRVGMHTGPVVAGVIGTRKFAYDLWGDTVNTASRMESHGEPGRIQLTEATAAALGGAFELEERGSIEVKGKGALRTFWLTGERP